MKSSLTRKWVFLKTGICMAAACIAFTACENTIGLGSIVDTSAPAIVILTDHGTGPGSFLSGEATIYIDATDDYEIQSVYVTYTYSSCDSDGKAVEQPPQTVRAEWNEEFNCYTVDINTNDMADGKLAIRVTASDTSNKKTKTPELIYTVKNKPPSIFMQIPKPRTQSDELLNDHLNPKNLPGVVFDNYIMGVFEDLAGVASGYPLIKFWKHGETEPGLNGTDYTANSGWASVSGYEYPDEGDLGWVRVDDGLVENESGEKGGSFRFYLRERLQDGTPEDAGENKGLAADIYNLKILTKDVNGRQIVWPTEAYSNAPDYMAIQVAAAGTPPNIDLKSPEYNKIYHSKNFMISASAVHQGDLDNDIAEMYIEVMNHNKRTVRLAHWHSGSVSDNEIKSYEVKIGDTVHCVAGSGESVTFNDGNYNFNIWAVGDAGSSGSYPFSIYIDSMSPNTQVTKVFPFFSQKTQTKTWTVNSTVQISVSSTDNRGSSYDEENKNWEKLKFLFLKGVDLPKKDFNDWIIANPQSNMTLDEYLKEHLYQYEKKDERIKAMFFGEVKDKPIPIPDGVPAKNSNPLIKVSGDDGAYILTLQTHKWDADVQTVPYSLYVYITAMDNAGNVSYDKITLHVDQNTDKPEVKFTNFKTNGSNFLNDKSNISFNVTDDDGIASESVFYRFAKNETEKNNFAGDNGWIQFPLTITGDGKNVVVNNLSVQRIACDLNGCNDGAAVGHTMDEIHKSALGNETESKFIQARAFDSTANKIYKDTDGVVFGDSGDWVELTVDLTYPKITASETDLNGNHVDRDANENAFLIPQREGSYKEFNFAYGDIVEHNLAFITIKINGDENLTKKFPVPSEIQTLKINEEPDKNTADGFAVWKVQGTENGRLRWRVPMNNKIRNTAKHFFEELQDGSHTFEISFEDKVPQITTRSLTFFRDKDGPNVDLIVPSEKIAVDNLNNISAAQQTALTRTAIMDAQAKLIGFFNDSFSPVFEVGGNNGYYFKISGAGFNSGWKFVKIPDENISGGKSASWQIDLDGTILHNVPNGSLPDGTYLLNLRIKDSRGNGYGITADDDAAVEEAIAKAKAKGSKHPNSGPGFEKNLAFRLDRSAPILSMNGIDPFINGEIVMEGTITNTSAVRRLSVRQSQNELIAGGSEVLGGVSKDGGIEYSNNFGKVFIAPTKGVENSFNYKITIDSLTEGAYSFVITVVGGSGQSAMEVRTFTYDTTAPSVNFSVPSTGTVIASGKWKDGSYKVVESGIWVTGRPEIKGQSEDANGLDSIFYHLGRLDETNNTRDKIFDINSGYWSDTALNTGNPTGSWKGGLFNWTFQHDLNRYYESLNEIYKHNSADENDKKFFIPLYVRAADMAGNVTVVQYKIWVDPDADMPTTAVSFPEPGMSVGGEVRISGTANDNNMVQSVEIRIKPDTQAGDPSALLDILNRNGGYYKDDTDEWAYPESKADEKGWIKANIQGPNDIAVSWFYTSNKSGLLSPVTNQSRQVTFEVRAIDTKDFVNKTPGLKGGAVSRIVYFDAGVPMIDTPKIKKTGIDEVTYADGIRTSGLFKITTTVRDDGGISAIRARASGNSGFVDIVKNGLEVSGNGNSLGGSSGVTWRITRAPDEKLLEASDSGEKTEDGKFFKYDLEFTVDTINNASLTYGKTGNFTLELQVYDNNKSPAAYNTNGTYTLGIDNFYPLTDITTQYNAATENFYVMGTARDYGAGSGALQGLERVLVYFQRGNNYYNALGDKNNQPNRNMITRPNVRDTSAENFVETDQAPNAPNFQNFPVIRLEGGVWKSEHAMVIDRQEISGDIDGDGTYDEMWNKEGSLTEWYAKLNTRLFNDGPLTVHYIVMDQAGNATHYQENIYIGNNRPLIRFINMGTDADLSQSIEDNEYASTTWIASDYVNGVMTGTVFKEAIKTNFRVRNNSFEIKLTALYGNNAKRYRVFYVDESQNVEIGPDKIVTGEVYTIVDMVSDTDWRRYGAPSNLAGTTFVASTAVTPVVSNNPGRVIKYTYKEERYGNFSTHGNSAPGDIAKALFNDFANIPDSQKETSADGNMIAKNDRLFIIKIYDATVQSQPLIEADQLAHVAMIRVDIDNKDEIPAKIDLAPFGKKFVLRSTDGAKWSNNADKILRDAFESEYNENIALERENNKDVRKGYVQYAAHSSGANADISGKVIFKGKAMDNQRIQKITAAVAGYNNSQEFTIAEWRDGEVKPVSGHSKADVNADWYFEAEQQYLSLEYGHALNWNFSWDSSTVNGIVAKDVNITFKVYDFASNAASDNTDRILTTVNIVPYISEIVTPLSAAYSINPSAFNRSALGWYPVREDDTIEIKGFNFNGASTTVTVNGVSLNGVAAVKGKPKTHISARVDNNASANDANTVVSGPLTVTVNGIASINNSNHKTAHYNQEPNGLNNNTLNDDRNLYVWNTGYLLNERVVQNPFMRMDSNGNRYMSYGIYTGNNGRFRVTKNNDNLNTDVETYYNRYRNTTVAFDTAGDWYAASSNMSAFDQSAFTFFARTTAGGVNGAGGANKRIIMRILNGGVADADRVRVPRIAVQNNNGTVRGTNNNATRIFMSYYDSNNSSGGNPVYFKYGLVGQNDSFAGNLSNNNTSGTPADVQTVADDNQIHKGGVYTAVGYLSNGLPVIAWYDRVNQNLVFSHANQLKAPLATGTTALPEVNVTANGNGTEFVYTANHSFTEPPANAGNAHTVFVGKATTTANDRRYVRRINGNKFMLDNINNGTGVNANNGEDFGGPSVSIIPPVNPSATAISAAITANTRQYTVTAHGLAGLTQVVINNNGTWTEYYARVVDADTLKFSTSNANAPAANTFLNQGTIGNVFMYLPSKSFKAARNSEQYYTTTTALGNLNSYVGRTVTVNGVDYIFAEAWTGNNTNNFKLANIATGEIVLPNTANVTVTVIGAPAIVTTYTADWQANAVVVQNFAGTHVDMAVDGENNVHLAYYDVRNGGLYYAFIPVKGAGTGAVPDTGVVKTVRVDTYLSAGTKLMINVRLERGRYVPYISYYHASFAETGNSIRVAWLLGDIADGTKPDDSFSGAWEVMTVPAGAVPLADEFVTNGVPVSPSTAWAPTGGTLRGRDISKSILVGYMTADWYEGAVLKHDIWK